MNDYTVVAKFREGDICDSVMDINQRDRNIILQIEGLSLPDPVEVHFSLTEYDGEAPVSIGRTVDGVTTVEIPEFILENENEEACVIGGVYRAYAFVYVTDGESGRTERKIVFHIKARPKPTTNVPEPKQDPFLEEVRQVMAETKEIAQSVREDADNGKFNGKDGESGASEIDEEQLLKFAIKTTTDKAPFHHITDSANYRVLEFGMEGKTEQETVPGNQLFDISKFNSDDWITNNGDGTLTSISYTPRLRNKLSVCCPNIAAGMTVIVTATGSNGIYFGNTYKGYNSPFEVTQEMIDNDYIAFYGASNQTSADNPSVISNIMINEGTTALPWEPYVGGAPSPNPDYPQEIVNAGKLGKNLWNAEYASNIKNWDITSTTNWYLMPVKVGKGVTVTISYKNELSTGISLYAGVGTNTLSISKWMYDISTASMINRVVTLTSTEDNIYIHCNSGTFDNFMRYIGNDLQIEIGDTATDYEPYCYKIDAKVVNKNYFNKEWIKDGSTYDVQAGSYWRKYFYLEPNTTYRCVVKKPFHVNNSVYLCFLGDTTNHDGPGANGIITILDGHAVDKQVRFTTPEDGKMLIKTNNNGMGIYTDKFEEIIDDEETQIMIYKYDGVVDDTYVPHASQSLTLTSPVPITKWDYLTKRDGVWGWSIWSGEFNINKDRYAGNVATWDDMLLFPLYNTPLIGSRNEAFCKQFRFIANPQTASVRQEAIDWSGVQINVCLHKSRGVLDVDSFRTYVTENPIHIQYHAAEELAFHPLPENEQTLLNNLETYYGVTNVYNEQGCPMWLNYVNDTKLYVDKKLLEIQQAMI